MSRTRTSRLLVAAALPLVLMGCGSSTADADADAEAEQGKAPTSTSVADLKERARNAALPSGECPLLSEAALRGHFPNAPAELESRYRDKTYPSCTYIWVTQAKRTMKMGAHTAQVQGEGRVSLTVAPVRAPEADWQRVLSSYRIEPPVAVDGIGDKAVWSDQRHQLSVLVPNWVLHVAVEDDDAPGTGREQAIAIARDILPGLK